MTLRKRLDAIEKRAQPKRGQRLFVCDPTGAYSEGGEPRTRQDVDDAARQGFETVILRVVYEARAGE